MTLYVLQGDKSKKRSSRKVALPKKQKSVTEPVKATARFTDVGGVDNTLIVRRETWVCKFIGWMYKSKQPHSIPFLNRGRAT